MAGSQFDVMAVLANIPLLSTLNRSQKQQLSQQLQRKQFKKNEALMVEGEQGDKLYIIVSVRNNFNATCT